MALARAVTFDGVTSDRMQDLRSRMEAGDPPEGMPPAEIIVLHDAQSDKALVLLLLDSEDDYAKADAVLNAMPMDDTPGQRTSVTKYDVAMRMSS